MEKHLDPEKSVVISAPAGSGKTEKLARRYISLLEAGAEVEKVLCITFTEKAAAEMKQRIIEILGRERPALLDEIRPRVPLMRISTIHAFCLKVLKRFSIELGIDPSLSVADELTSGNLWTEAMYEALMAEREAPGGFFDLLKDKGLRGWVSVRRALDYLHEKSPYPEMYLEQGAGGEGAEDDGRRLVQVYVECLRRYRGKKAALKLLDFNDIELLAAEALTNNPEWHNILYSFDEHTDHLLVDEFQDTSTLQWRIVRKLTEEWRSGMGAKREQGGRPTLFLVGDEKQSIYMFRGANSGIFAEARRELAEWLGGEFVYEEAKENYRSLPAIVDFTNALFEKLMPKASNEWMTPYSGFEATRQGEGRVELLLLGAREDTRATRLEEARALARRISGLRGAHKVFEDGAERPSKFSDMAILLRRRTHLGIFEDALRRENVPFVVLKGIGFYDEPETAVLRHLVSFLVDPSDGYNLFCLLRSPLFSFDYGELAGLFAAGGDKAYEKLNAQAGEKGEAAARTLQRWLLMGHETPMASVLEQALVDTRCWGRFHERQRRANIKKFISMVEAYAAQGFSPIEMREKLLRQGGSREVAKANVSTEGMDAVRVMTIHAAKGLQFPMVFIPSMEESISPKSGAVALDEYEGLVRFSYEEDSKLREKDEHFRRIKFKELEEEKRLFYVAVTRARDFLCMLGSARPPKEEKAKKKERKDEAYKSRLGYLIDAFGPLDRGGLPFEVVKEIDLEARAYGPAARVEAASRVIDEPLFVEPLSYKPARIWRDVTEGEAGGVAEGIWHGKEGRAVGTVVHALLEEMSKGLLAVDGIEERAKSLFDAEGVRSPDVLGAILDDFRALGQSGLLEEIVLPRPGSYAELPFVLERGGYVYRGRIDRLVLKDGVANLYDYKTFPVREGELAELKERYAFQMEVYREAAERLFSVKVEPFLVFTHGPRVVPV